MKDIFVSFVNCFADSIGFTGFDGNRINYHKFRAYHRYISNSHKVKSQNVIDGMAATASVIEALGQRMGTLTLAIALVGDIKLNDNDELGGFMAGVDLVMNKYDKLLADVQCKEVSEGSVSKALLHAFGHLPEEEMVNKCFEVCTIAEEIESTLKK